MPHDMPHAGGLVAAVADVELVAMIMRQSSDALALPPKVIPAFEPESSRLSSSGHYLPRAGGLIIPHLITLVAAAVNDNNVAEYLRVA